MPDRTVVLDADDMRRTLTRIAHEIVESGGDPAALAIVGIHRRGAVLATRLQGLLAELHGVEVPLGDLDTGPTRMLRLGRAHGAALAVLPAQMLNTADGRSAAAG